VFLAIWTDSRMPSIWMLHIPVLTNSGHSGPTPFPNIAFAILETVAFHADRFLSRQGIAVTSNANRKPVLLRAPVSPANNSHLGFAGTLYHASVSLLERPRRGHRAKNLYMIACWPDRTGL
jgi:hypothetical protein